MKKPTQNGIATPVIVTEGKPPAKTSIYPLGKKHYETTDRLGNVRVTYTDKKSWQQNKFALNVSSTQDYYPFGAVMEGRKYNLTAYRYAFNTQERVPELNESHYTALYWEYDGRLARRWNRDPKPQLGWSLYVTFNDNPILFTDWLGDIPPELLVRGGIITSSFGKRTHPITGKIQIHRAIDIAAKINEPVHAYASGTIVWVGNEKEGTGWGNYIVIQHSNGYYSLYAHLNEINVKIGQNVKDDDVIGKVGKTGRATGPHLHVEVGKAKNLKEFLSLKYRDITRENPIEIGDLEKHIQSINDKMENDFQEELEQKHFNESANWAKDMINFMKEHNKDGIFDKHIDQMKDFLKIVDNKEKNENKNKQNEE